MEEKRYLHGLKEVMEFFGCSRGKASILVHTTLRPASFQDGRIILVDLEKALELLRLEPVTEGGK